MALNQELRDRIDEKRERVKQKEKELRNFQDEFDQALKGVYNERWWRQFIKLIKQRRHMLSEQLEAGIFDSRKEEERARGQISELKLILILDRQGEDLQSPLIDEREI